MDGRVVYGRSGTRPVTSTSRRIRRLGWEFLEGEVTPSVWGMVSQWSDA